MRLFKKMHWTKIKRNSSRVRGQNQQSMSAANHSQLSIYVPKLQSVSGQQHVLNEQESRFLLGITEPLQ